MLYAGQLQPKFWRPGRQQHGSIHIQTLEKLDAAIQQVEAAIELFYAKRYAPAITLAGAAEGCLGLAPGGEDAAGDDEDIQVPEPLFELMKCGAMKQYGKTQKEVVARFNAARDWLKHETPDVPGRMELTNYDARPGSETPTISGFIDFSRKHYSAILGR